MLAFFFPLKTMKTDRIDYSKAPKEIQDMIQAHDTLSEICIDDEAEDKKLAAICRELHTAITEWERTQKDA